MNCTNCGRVETRRHKVVGTICRRCYDKAWRKDRKSAAAPLSPQETGRIVEALERYGGDMAMARKFLGLTPSIMKVRALQVLDHLLACKEVVAEALDVPLPTVAAPLPSVTAAPQLGKHISLEQRRERFELMQQYGIKQAALILGISTDVLRLTKQRHHAWATENGFASLYARDNGPVRIIQAAAEPIPEIVPLPQATILTPSQAIDLINMALVVSVRNSEVIAAINAQTNILMEVVKTGINQLSDA